MYKQILIPLDGSELSKAALPHACELSRAFGARVALLYVVELIPRTYFWATDPYSVAAAESAIELQERRELEAAEQFLGEIKDDLKAQGIDSECTVLMGDPGSQICDYARAINADLIVMTTHGRSGIQRWVYGSVAEKVLRGADVPVLLVRARQQASG